MAHQTSEPNQIESLPTEILSVILDVVAKESSSDFVNTISSCKGMATWVDREVYRNLNLSSFVKKPLMSNGYNKIMEKCLASGNLDAHYVKGILCYFNENRGDEGMRHLTISENGGHMQSLYLFGIILLCNDRIAEGNHCLQQLKWEDNTEAADACWKQIKKSLHGIRVERKAIYYTSMAKLQPGEECHINDLDNSCDKCFGFKRVVKFMFMM